MSKTALYIGAAVATTLVSGAAAAAVIRRRRAQQLQPVQLLKEPMTKAPVVFQQMKPVGTFPSGAVGLTKISSAAGIVGAGLALNELQGQLVDKVAGNAAGNVVRVFGQVGIPVLVGRGAAALVGTLGGSKGLQHTTNQLVGVGTAAAAVFGAPALVGVASAKAVGEGASWLIGTIGGKQAERDVRNAVSQLDPFKTGSLAQQAVAPVGNAIRDVGKFFGGLFGGGQK